MSGLIDTNTGLRFGDGLIWAAPIGGAGLDIVTDPTPNNAMISEGGVDMITEAGVFMITEA